METVRALHMNSQANKLDPFKCLTPYHFLGSSSPTAAHVPFDVANSNRMATPVFFGMCQVNGTALNEQQLEQLRAEECNGRMCCC